MTFAYVTRTYFKLFDFIGKTYATQIRVKSSVIIRYCIILIIRLRNVNIIGNDYTYYTITESCFAFGIPARI